MSSTRELEIVELQKVLTNIQQGVGALVRHNERIWSGFRQIEIGMIGAQSLHEVISILTSQIPALFPNVSCVSLSCLNSDYDFGQYILGESDTEFSKYFNVINMQQLAMLGIDSGKPRLGPSDPELSRLLFPDCDEEIASLAIIPLKFRGKLIGSLNQASRDPAHFTKTSATDLVEHLAAVTAMCIDNAVNHERLKHDGLTDPLTGVANRRLFEHRLHEEVGRWARHGHPLSCILVDVDLFKVVNDSYGHAVGDKVLHAVANALARNLRSGDVLARYGGEEFCLLLPATDINVAALIADRMRQGIANLVFRNIPIEGLRITISAGLVCLDDKCRPTTDDVGAWLIENADAALYQAKQSGRNKVMVASNHVARDGLSSISIDS
jgi:two-component system, cell cycle response regulator